MDFSKQGQPNTGMHYQPDSGNRFPIVPPRVRNGCTHQSKSVIHPNAVGYSWNKKINGDPDHSVHGLRQIPAELTRQGTELRQPIVNSSDFHPKNGRRALNNDSTVCSSKHSYLLPREDILHYPNICQHSQKCPCV